MSFRTKVANWLLRRAEKIAVTKGNGVKLFHHHDRQIDMKFVDRGEPGEGRAYDGTQYKHSVVYLGENGNSSYIDPHAECEECDSGHKIHSQLFTGMMQSDGEEKFFSDSLKKWCQYAAFGGIGAFFAAIFAAIMVFQYAG